jgi:hypothetical protein
MPKKFTPPIVMFTDWGKNITAASRPHAAYLLEEETTTVAITRKTKSPIGFTKK